MVFSLSYKVALPDTEQYCRLGLLLDINGLGNKECLLTASQLQSLLEKSGVDTIIHAVVKSRLDYCRVTQIFQRS